MNEPATLAGVLEVLEPGETVTYGELLTRMRKQQLPTSGVGLVLAEFSVARRWHGHEIATWREPTWDAELAGAWTDGLLWIARRPTEGDDGA